MSIVKGIPFMCDVHMHIIPGVDDGSWDMDMSEQMLRIAHGQGIRSVMATPHSSAFIGENHNVRKNFEQLQERVRAILPDMRLYFGCEVRCGGSYIDITVDRLKAGIFPTLNETAYVLTEFSTHIKPEQAIKCACRLKDGGWTPVIAHVERYLNLFQDFRCIELLREMGCLFQINVYSVFEEENEQIKANAIKLTETKMVSFLGSDAHRTFHRPPSVRYGLKYLYENYDREYLDQITFKNAEELLKMQGCGKPESLDCVLK